MNPYDRPIPDAFLDVAQGEWQHDRRRDATRVITEWPVREQYVKGESGASTVDVLEVVIGSIVLSVCFVALALGLIAAGAS